MYEFRYLTFHSNIVKLVFPGPIQALASHWGEQRLRYTTRVNCSTNLVVSDVDDLEEPAVMAGAYQKPGGFLARRAGIEPRTYASLTTVSVLKHAMEYKLAKLGSTRSPWRNSMEVEDEITIE